MGEKSDIEHVFGKVLKELRVNKSLSQEKLSEKSGLDRTFISLLERGLRQPSIATVFRLAQALNVSPVEMIKKVETGLNENT